ncbi:thioredoxin [Aphelenchoides avenae]|nr:thioredoxin [Aphelenchus avenae]
MRAVGLETRFVVDNADHVWTEIWSEELDRWVHCDPCENVIDTPLMYEKGWGKKYAYVFAFALDHVQDVSWRYSLKRTALLKRRRMCREAVLRNFIKKLNLRLSKNVSDERRAVLRLRCMKEVIEFLTPKFQLRDGSEAQNYGRKIGRRAVAQAEGELGPAGSAQETIVIRPTAEELEKKFIMIEYDCVSDKYKRSGKDVEGGFATLTHTTKNVFRKVESDWKMAYLCRRPGAVNGELSWKIEIPPEYVGRVSSATVKLGRLDTFGSGKVTATMCCGDVCGRIPADTGVYIISSPTSNVPYVEVNVSFYGGDGENAWQHAQLFRAKLDEPEGNMRLRIDFK